ncbi:MAG: mevalonate kinase [Chloroflexi bacterium]|nr:mevalonate kinase [Chloroflexota bacterium]MBU1662874.1 mevalonate kinase [Chloroflexota bacterium]
MPAFTASAPGKIILFGEHAVVFGQPAIAVPVTQVRATATVTPDIRRTADDMQILAPDVGVDSPLRNLPPGEPIGEAVRGVAAILGVHRFPACTLKVTSTIPMAAGLGSGTAVSVAIIRALAGFLGQHLPDEQVSALAYEVEKIHHGTPSGIDNTVVTYARSVYFVKGQPAETFAIAQPFTIVIGNTGISSPTAAAVGDVRQAWQDSPARYERFFAAAGSIAKTARQAIESGHPDRLGPLMDENHEMLQKMGVSSPELDRLVTAAREAGALGAKLSGGGRGGNMIALAAAGRAVEIAQALREAGATGVILTKCSAS